MFEAFVAGLLLITLSELGDKSFFIAMFMACRHSRLLVFAGVASALVVMTLLSVAMAQVLSFLPEIYVRCAEVLLFLIFGVRLVLQSRRIPAGLQASCQEACQEAVEAVKQAAEQLPQPTQLGLVLQSFGLTFLAEWGDRTQIATIGLASSKDAMGVALGAILGHAICSAIAVLGGKLIAGRLSEKALTLLGGLLFLIFALLGMMKLGQTGWSTTALHLAG